MVKIYLLGQTKDDRDSTPSDEEISCDRAAFKITNHWGIIQVYQSLSTAKWWQNPQINTINCVNSLYNVQIWKICYLKAHVHS